jgi:hypothetical protein
VGRLRLRNHLGGGDGGMMIDDDDQFFYLFLVGSAVL